MADKKVIAVVGATGAQGGGLVRAILSDPRDGFCPPASPAPSSPPARAGVLASEPAKTGARRSGSVATVSQ